jgi:pyroglutamyl-peptidase
MTNALVIGFGPFPGARKNPSGALARRLGRRKFVGTRIAAEVLPTTYAAVAKALPALIARRRPDIVLFFGLARRADCLRIETRAVNAQSTLHPDAAGFVPRRRPIAPGAPRRLAARASVRRLVDAARSAQVPVKVSRNAGRYVCNAALFTCLDLARKSGRPKRVAFVHIPKPGTRRCGPSRSSRPIASRSGRPTMASLARAAEAILAALIAEARR